MVIAFFYILKLKLCFSTMTKELQQCLALTIWPTFNQGACCVSLHDPVRLGITIAFLLAIYYNYASCCAGLSSVAYSEKPFKFRVQKCCERSSYMFNTN